MVRTSAGIYTVFLISVFLLLACDRDVAQQTGSEVVTAKILDSAIDKPISNSASSNSAHKTTTISEINAIAKRDLKHFLNKIPPGEEPKYGFKDRSEFKLATLGSPYRMMTIHPDQLRAGTYLADHLIDLNSYRYPVMIGSEQRALLTLERVNGDWRAVDYGATVLAKDLQNTESRVFPGADKNASRSILRLFQLQSDYLIITEDRTNSTELNLAPLESARRILPQLRNMGLTPIAKLGPIWKEAIRTVNTAIETRVQP